MAVFVSHSDLDKDAFKLMCTRLEDVDVGIWKSSKMIAGELLAEQLRAAIDACSSCVFIATPQSVDSRWCMAELGAFWGAGKPVVIFAPQPLDPATLPPEFAGCLRTDDASQVLKAVRRYERDSQAAASLIAAIDESGKGEIYSQLLSFIGEISDGDKIRVLCQHSADDGEKVDEKRCTYLKELLQKVENLSGVGYHRLVSRRETGGKWISEHVTKMEQLRVQKANGLIRYKPLDGRFLSCDILFVKGKFAIVFFEVVDQESKKGQVEGAVVLHGPKALGSIDIFDRLFTYLWD
ncbi:MAG: toll/interleukin-1 receptor domain-containing protein [Pirellulaceae bacterium]